MKLTGWSSIPLRHAVRSRARRPTRSLVATVTLALGIGANTAIFSIINAVLLRPLPLAEPSRLVMVWRIAGNQNLTEGLTSYPDFKDWREQSKAFASLGAYWSFPNGDVNVTGGTDPERVSVARITPGFFETLGVVPAYGRTFLPEESIVGNHRRAILSFGLWKRQFGSDPALVGKSVVVNGFPYQVVGIMPPDIRELGGSLGTDVDLWRPLVPDDNQTGGRDSRRLHSRLGRGTAKGSARAGGRVGRTNGSETQTDGRRGRRQRWMSEGRRRWGRILEMTLRHFGPALGPTSGRF